MAKARQWIERGRASDDPVDRFRDLWTAFNNLYAPLKGSERKRIDRFLDDFVTEETAERILESHAEDVEYLIERPVVDMRRNSRDTRRNIDSFHSAEDRVGALKEIILITYQIRCNLIHGQKTPDRRRDIKLCLHASSILLSVLDATN